MENRTIVYVDAFNLYYNLLKKSKMPDGSTNKWLDLNKLFTNLLRKDKKLIKIKYFTAIIKGYSASRQAKYLEALSTFDNIEIIKGHIANKKCTYPNPNKSQHNKEISHNMLEEKQTDVNIALHMLNDAWENNCDTFVLVSNDSDLVPALKMVKSKEKETVVFAPVGNQNVNNAIKADYITKIKQKDCSEAQLPNKIGKITKPIEW